jgi:hypothetical protein
VIVNDDAIVSLIHGGNPALYHHGLKPLYKSLETHILNTAVAMGRDVVVDKGVNISPNARRRWLGLASSLDVPITAIEFPREAAGVHAQRRFDSDNRGHSLPFWQRVAEAHERQYVGPELDEGFTQVSLATAHDIYHR